MSNNVLHKKFKKDFILRGLYAIINTLKTLLW